LRAAEGADGPAARRSAGPAAAYGARRVHYVEDNETNVAVMQGILSQRPQVLLDTSPSGRAGLAALAATRPDLVLLDMQLPDISGLDVLHAMKADPQLAGLPVVVVSADATAGQVRAALAAGALHYVTKPVDLDTFLVLVDGILDGLPATRVAAENPA
jgi:CheY-like chemotaxis protein